jgi:hypothetical protein
VALLTFHTSRHPQGAGILHVAGDDLAGAAGMSAVPLAIMAASLTRAPRVAMVCPISP